MQEEFSDTTLMAYADGELDAHLETEGAQHLGLAPHHTSPARDPQAFADFCAWMIDRYAPARL